LKTGKLERKIRGHKGWVTSIAVTPDGQRVVYGLDNGTIRVWNLETGITEQTLKVQKGPVQAVLVTPDGHHAISGSRAVQVWNIESGKMLHTLDEQDVLISSIGITPDGRQVVSGGLDRTLHLWALDTGREIAHAALRWSL